MFIIINDRTQNQICVAISLKPSSVAICYFLINKSEACLA